MPLEQPGPLQSQGPLNNKGVLNKRQDTSSRKSRKEQQDTAAAIICPGTDSTSRTLVCSWSNYGNIAYCSSNNRYSLKSKRAYNDSYQINKKL